MLTIHWLAESGEPEAHIVCAFDFQDRAMAADYGFDLYAAVHGFNRGKLGFLIKDHRGSIVHEWRRDGDLAGTTYAEPAEPIAAPPMSRPRVRAPGRRAKGGFARVAAALARPKPQEPAERRHERARPAPQAETAASLRRFAPAIQLAPVPTKKRRVLLKLGGDHYALAAIMMAALLVGSPLYSIYATVDRMQQGGVMPLQDASGVAADVRAGAAAVLSTKGQLDFRKLFWHLRVVAPTEIDLLAYDPGKRADGPRIIFTTRDMLRWQMESLRRGDRTAIVAATASTS